MDVMDNDQNIIKRFIYTKPCDRSHYFSYVRFRNTINQFDKKNDEINGKTIQFLRICNI